MAVPYPRLLFFFLTRIMTRLSFLCVLVAIFSNLGLEHVSSQDLFPDKNLEAVVRREVFEKRNSKDPLVAKDVENISQIKGIGKSIKSLKGLEACISLRSIWLDQNEIVDVSPLQKLDLLQQVMLKENKIVDVTPLKDLKKLQHLDLSNNQIESIAALSEFSNMRSFYVAHNKIKDLGVVTNYTKAWSIYAQGNPINDLKPVSGLRFLDHLDVSKTLVMDLSALSPLTNLKRVMLEDSKVTDLTTLVEMAKKDAAGEMRFSPFWNIHLKGCKLSEKAKTAQIQELKKLGSRIHTE